MKTPKGPGRAHQPDWRSKRRPGVDLPHSGRRAASGCRATARPTATSAGTRRLLGGRPVLERPALQGHRGAAAREAVDRPGATSSSAYAPSSTTSRPSRRRRTTTWRSSARRTASAGCSPRRRTAIRARGPARRRSDPVKFSLPQGRAPQRVAPAPPRLSRWRRNIFTIAHGTSTHITYIGGSRARFRALRVELSLPGPAAPSWSLSRGSAERALRPSPGRQGRRSRPGGRQRLAASEAGGGRRRPASVGGALAARAAAGGHRARLLLAAMRRFAP